MILNNLDKAVAQFPEELVTYGGNGQVFSNWAQVRLHQIIQIIFIVEMKVNHRIYKILLFFVLISFGLR
jgi:hypothetical protein